MPAGLYEYQVLVLQIGSRLPPSALERNQTSVISFAGSSASLSSVSFAPPNAATVVCVPSSAV